MSLDTRELYRSPNGDETVQNLGGLTLACGTKDGPIARPRRGLGQGWPAPIRRTPRFWTVSSIDPAWVMLER
jgi:hypothetical protein